jgi:tyrosine-protein phosphatase YwqE
MKTTFLFLFLFLFSNPSITEIRKLYGNVLSSESNAKEFASKLNEVSKEDNKTLVAYKGASLTIISKLEKKISDKSKKFKEGSSLIEYAVANEPNSIEIRMIRLSVQENVPKIVHYRGNKKEDKKFLLDHYKEQTGTLKTYIGDFIAQSKSFTTAEKLSVK